MNLKIKSTFGFPLVNTEFVNKNPVGNPTGFLFYLIYS